MRFKCLFTKEIFKDEGSFIAPVDIHDPVVIKAIELYNEDQRHNYAGETAEELNSVLIDFDTLVFDEWTGIGPDAMSYMYYAQRKMIETLTGNIVHDLNNITAIMKTT